MIDRTAAVSNATTSAMHEATSLQGCAATVWQFSGVLQGSDGFAAGQARLDMDDVHQPGAQRTVYFTVHSWTHAKNSLPIRQVSDGLLCKLVSTC